MEGGPRMTEQINSEELFKKNFPEYVTEKGMCLSPYWNIFCAGLEAGEPKWHKPSEKLPEENQWVLVYDGGYTVCNYHSYTPIKWLDTYENEVYEGNIIKWCEIPKFEA
jgi:hypothetical protein